VVALVIFAVIMRVLAVRRLERRLIQ